VTEQDIITGCRKKDRRAQKALYDLFAPRLYGVCRRYVKDPSDAEEILVTGLFKAMTRIEKYSGKGSFEGWIRKILVNECLMFLRSSHNFHQNVELKETDLTTEVTIEAELAAKDLRALLSSLPTGYRTVFNLYVIEGYKHREIAEMLGISINTSKSQLLLAKQKLRDLILENKYHDVG